MNFFENLFSSSLSGADSAYGCFSCFVGFSSFVGFSFLWFSWVVVETMATSKSGLVMGDGDRQLDFDRELKWCIQSLEGCLKEKHCDPKSKKVFDVLNSSKASLVRKR